MPPCRVTIAARKGPYHAVRVQRVDVYQLDNEIVIEGAIPGKGRPK